jgi:hypothetical protein
MLSIAVAAATLALQGIPQGPAKLDLDVKGDRLEVFTYKPSTYRGERIIMVLHGTLRNADTYRDHSTKMAERFGALVVAPMFDAQRFPSNRYQFGGIRGRDGQAAPREEWTYSYIPEIVNHVRQIEGRPELPFWIIGHSAGGQFLVRMSGFFDSGAERVVVANAGSFLFPTREQPFGYGFGSLPPELSSDDVIRRYLAQPVTLYLGTADDGPDQYFDTSREAMRQGGGRYSRNVAGFEAARELASRNGWPFNWRIVLARGVAHDHQAMFEHPQADMALFGRYLPFFR